MDTFQDERIEQFVSLLKSELASAERILVTTHSRPDGDALGALFATGWILDQLGKYHELVSDKPFPRFVKLLPNSGHVRIPDEQGWDGVLEPFDYIIAVDASELKLLGSIYEKNKNVFDSAKIVNIDHHATNTKFGHLNLVLGEATSASEMVYFIIKQLRLTIDHTVAAYLLTGIVTDTQCFRTQNTVPRILRAAAELMDKGAPLSTIVDVAFRTWPASTVKLWGYSLSKMQTRDGVAWTEVTQEMLSECNADETAAGTVIYHLSGAIGEQRVAALFIQKTAAETAFSLRSSLDVNVSEIAKQFGGGGHPQAAGGLIREDLDAAKTKVLSAITTALSTIPGDQKVTVVSK